MTNQWMGRVSTIPPTSHLYSRIVVMIHHPRCREQHSKRPGFDKPSPRLADDFTEFAREDGPIPRTTGWPKKRWSRNRHSLHHSERPKLCCSFFILRPIGLVNNLTTATEEIWRRGPWHSQRVLTRQRLSILG